MWQRKNAGTRAKEEYAETGEMTPPRSFAH